MENESLYIVMPAYNEQDNIKSVIEAWYPVLENGNGNSRLVVADGGSTDATLNILCKLKQKYPKLMVMSYPRTDHGTKLMILYKYSIKEGANWVFQTDSDGQTRPEEFKAFWDMRDNYDAVMGNRRKRGDGFGRKIVENVLRLYIFIFFGVNVPDANAPFRLMRPEVIEKYMPLIPKNFNLPNAILAACFTKYHEKVCYREITFMPRQGGKNYMNLKRIFKIGMESVRNFARIKRRMKKLSAEGKVV